MTPTRKSCTVAFPKECNYATSLSAQATNRATVPQPTGLKALATKVLTRNQQCNRGATSTKTACNFPPESYPQKFHGLAGCNQRETTRPLPSWCRTGAPVLKKTPVPIFAPACPGLKIAIRPMVPAWCKSFCERHHETDGAVWCCWEENETNWRRVRLDAMTECPLKRGG